MFARRHLGLAAVVLGMTAWGASAQDAVKTSQEPVKLERKWPKGETRSSDSTVKLHQIMTIQGMDIETDVEQSSVTKYTVGEPRSDGGTPVTSKVESVKVSLTLPGGVNVDYDSENPAPTPDDPNLKPIVDAFKATSDVEYTFVVDKDARITAVEGLEQVLAKIEAANADSAKMVKDRFQADAMKKTLNDELNILPDTLVRPGDSWARTQTQNLGMGQTLTFETKYTYEGTVEKDGKTLDKISAKSTSVKFAQDPNAESPARVTNANLKVESTDGQILFDRAAGRDVESKQSTRMVGPLTLSVMGQEIEVQLDLTVESSSKAK